MKDGHSSLQKHLKFWSDDGCVYWMHKKVFCPFKKKDRVKDDVLWVTRSMNPENGLKKGSEDIVKLIKFLIVN